jgi:hypothetical protein
MITRNEMAGFHGTVRHGIVPRPYLPFHGGGLSLSLSRFTVLGRWITLVPRSAAHLIQQQAPGASVVEIEAPHCLLQCAPGPAVARIRAFLRSLP